MTNQRLLPHLVLFLSACVSVPAVLAGDDRKEWEKDRRKAWREWERDRRKAIREREKAEREYYRDRGGPYYSRGGGPYYGQDDADPYYGGRGRRYPRGGGVRGRIGGEIIFIVCAVEVRRDGLRVEHRRATTQKRKASLNLLVCGRRWTLAVTR